MLRLPCPHCGGTNRVDDRDLGHSVQCAHCRVDFVAADTLPPPTRGEYDPADDRFASPPRPDGSGLAVASALLGIGAIVTSVCCGAGAVLGLGGMITGFGGLRSRARGWAVLGLMLSLTGLILSVGVMVVGVGVNIIQESNTPPLPADGTKPPFFVPLKK